MSFFNFMLKLNCTLRGLKVKNMKVKILFKGMESDRQLEEYAEERIKLLEKLLKNESETFCDLRLGKDNNHHRHGKIYFAEAKIRSPKKNYGARFEAESLTEAIDGLKDELSKKIRRHKDKKISLRKKGGKIIKDFLRKIKK